MYVITYEVVQDECKPDFDRCVGGAFYKLFLANLDHEQSVVYTIAAMKADGWIPIKLANYGLIEPDDFDSGDSDYDYIQQALIDNEVIVIHTWTLE